jgi:hypothetical protein
MRRPGKASFRKIERLRVTSDRLAFVRYALSACESDDILG